MTNSRSFIVFNKILAIIVAIMLLVGGLLAIYVIPEFEKLFSGFGSDLPCTTKFMLMTHNYWLVLVVIPIAVYIRLSSKKELTKPARRICLSTLLVMFLVSVTLIPFITISMYMPIFAMGKVVGR